MRDSQNNILFPSALTTDGPRVLAPVSRIQSNYDIAVNDLRGGRLGVFGRWVVQTSVGLACSGCLNVRLGTLFKGGLRGG